MAKQSHRERRPNPRVLVLVLAGGEGRRLFPLTRDRAKPAVPFGGTYRLVDFVLSNFANAGYLKVAVLTQYKSHSLERHLAETWSISPNLGNYIMPVTAQMRRGPHWFQGSADAVYQSINIIEHARPDVVCVFGADHIYRMDPREMVEFHCEDRSGATIAAMPIDSGDASSFGIITATANGRVRGFVEKPADLPRRDGHKVLASMGNYVFDTDLLLDTLSDNARKHDTSHDFGRDILPSLVASGVVRSYDFTTNSVPGSDAHYWRDVGTVDAYYDASMDLLAPLPAFDLYNEEWPIHTYPRRMPPAKLVRGSSGSAAEALESLLSPGSIISGARIEHSILGPKTFVDDRAFVADSVVFDDVRIGSGAVVRNCIIDKGVFVPPGMQVGVDRAADGERFVVSDGGVVVVPRGYDFGEETPLTRAERATPHGLVTPATGLASVPVRTGA